MARPRTVSDETILRATARVVAREGARRFTLQQVGDEAGISAPGILQRFGTKRALLLALSAHARRAPGDALREARAQHASHLDALVHGLADQMEGLGSPQAIARSLDYLALDIADPEFHAHARAYFDAMREEVRALLADAQAARELRRDADVDALARAVEVAFNGSVVAWAAHHREGTLADAMRHDLRAVLAPYLRTRRTGPAAPLPPAVRSARGAARASRGT